MKVYKQNIMVLKEAKEDRNNSTSYSIEEDSVDDESSATMIVNYLIKKFKLEFG